MRHRKAFFQEPRFWLPIPVSVQLSPSGFAILHGTAASTTTNIPLIGMKVSEADRKTGKMGICDYLGYSESTVLYWIKTMNFPARKLGGRWVSTSEDVYRFLQNYVSGKTDHKKTGTN